MHLRHSISTGTITVDKSDIFRIRRDSEHEGAITTHGAEFGYRVYGPFGQGYRIGLYNGTEEIETLEYHWREGACIHPGPRDIMVDCHEGDFSRGRAFGKIQRGSDSIAIDCPPDVAPLNPLEVGLLTVLDHLWARRLGPFARKTG